MLSSSSSTSRCMSCLVVVLSVAVVPNVVTSMYVEDNRYGISPDDVHNWAVATLLDRRNADVPLPLTTLIGDAFPDNAEFDPSMPAAIYPTPLKRNRGIYSSRSVSNKRNSLNELIRRLMALQGQRMPEGRASMMRFGSGRK